MLTYMSTQTDCDSTLVPGTDLPQVTLEPREEYTAGSDPSSSLKPDSSRLLWLSTVQRFIVEPRNKWEINVISA